MRLCGSKRGTLEYSTPESRPEVPASVHQSRYLILFSKLVKIISRGHSIPLQLMVVMSDLSPSTRRSSELGYAPHVSRGSIFWLPARGMCDERLLLYLDLDEGCYDHPVLVLRTNTKQATATVLIVRLDNFTIIEPTPQEEKKEKENQALEETWVSITC